MTDFGRVGVTIYRKLCEGLPFCSWKSAEQARWLACSALLTLVLAALCFAPLIAEAQEPDANQAVLIVDYGGGKVDSRCVSFAKESISGVELLELSGIPIKIGSTMMGVQVCEIAGVGCDPAREQCFCKCVGTSCTYWNYFQWRDGVWKYSPVGASQRTLRDGDADLWMWSDGKRLPDISPEGLCPAVNESPTAEAATPTATPLLIMSETSTPSSASSPATPSPAATSRGNCGFGMGLLGMLGAVLLGTAPWRRR